MSCFRNVDHRARYAPRHKLIDIKRRAVAYSCTENKALIEAVKRIKRETESFTIVPATNTTNKTNAINEDGLNVDEQS